MAKTNAPPGAGSGQRPSVWTLNEVVLDTPLTAIEKRFLLIVERGDVASTKRHIDEHKDDPEFNIDCTDPMGRSALITAVDNENMDMLQMLLENGVQVKDALLEAIREQYVEGVEALLDWEEKIHKPGELYSWESVDRAHSKFSPDLTPLMLAAHLDNFEIIKILLDRGATIPNPHDLKCSCEECLDASDSDSLRHSLSRINAYKALSSPSLIVLSSKDPLLTAFELSSVLAKLRKLENEFSEEYKDMRTKVHEFTGKLLDYTRSQKELEMVLNFNPEEGWEQSNKYALDRLKMALKYKQKNFVSHPNVQQLLTAIWYDGLPGFKRLSQVEQIFQVAKMFILFPYYCMMYALAPTSTPGQFITKPFVQFVCHKASYLYFLMCVCAASQRVEHIVVLILGKLVDPMFLDVLDDWKHRERGAFPGLFEAACVIFVMANIVTEIRSLWFDGLAEYITDMWNIVDFCSNMFYVTWIALRAVSIFIRFRETWEGLDPYYPREEWSQFDPYLLADGMFAAGMIFSVLKLVHVFSINPHLGPLQISLGRMVFDIIKFLCIYTLVLFAFGCGMNQLLWYYAELEMHRCHHPDPEIANFHDEEKACSIWRRFYNLFETSQSMFWASFGLVDLVSFELTGIKSFTRFWALLIFGSYSVINVIVLLNMLIAMMSSSYQIISERSDLEWKFARSKLWMSYFDAEDILPPPFNIMPSPGLFRDLLKLGSVKRTQSFKKRTVDKTQTRHDTVMQLLVKRYVTIETQRREDEYGITEDDVMEIRQDISSLRYELVDILKNNGMKTPDVDKGDSLAGKKSKQMERRLMKDFQIGCVENILSEVVQGGKGASKDIFSNLAKAISKKAGGSKASLRGSRSSVRDSKVSKDAFGRKKATDGSSANLKDQAAASQSRQEALINFKEVNVDEIVKAHPQLEGETKGTKVAFAKWTKGKERARERIAAKNATGEPPKSILAGSKPAAGSTSAPAPPAKNAAPSAPQASVAPKPKEPPKAAAEVQKTPAAAAPPPPPPAAAPRKPSVSAAPKPEERKKSVTIEEPKPAASAAPKAAAKVPAIVPPPAKTAAPAAKPAAPEARPRPSSGNAIVSGKSIISGRVLDGWL